MAVTAWFGLGLKDDATPQLGKFTGKVKHLGKTVVDVDNKMSMAFSNAVMFKGLNMLTTAITGSNDAIKEYTKNLGVLEVLTGSTAEETTRMSRAVRTAANDTRQLNTLASEASVVLGRMGRDQEEIASTLPGYMDLYTVSGTGMKEVLTAVGSTMNAFGIEVEYTNWVMNQMLATSSNSLQEFEEYAEAMKEVAPVAKEVGVSFHETSILIGKLADAGLRGTRGGTALKNMMLNLLKPSEGVAKVMKDMNLEGLTFTQLLEQLGKNTELVDALETFQKRAVAPFLKLSSARAEIEKLSDTVNANSDIVKSGAETIRDTLGEQLEITTRLVTNLGVNFVAAFQEISSNEALASVNTYLQNLNRRLIESPESIRGFVSGVNLALDVVGFFAKHVDTLVASLIALKGLQLARYAVTSIKVFSSEISLMSEAIRTSTTAVGGFTTAAKTLFTSNVLGLLVVAVTTAWMEFAKFNARLEDTERLMNSVSSEASKLRKKEFIGSLLEVLEEENKKLNRLNIERKEAFDALTRARIDPKVKNTTLEMLQAEIKTLDDQIDLVKRGEEIQMRYTGRGFAQKPMAVQVVPEKLREVVKEAGYEMEALEKVLIFEEKPGMVATPFNLVESLKATRNEYKELFKTPPLKPTAPVDITDLVYTKPEQTKFKDTLSKTSEAISLTEELRATLEKAGRYEFFDGYTKSVKISTDSAEDLLKRTNEFYKSFYTEDAKKANTWIRESSRSLVTLSGDMADLGSGQFLTYLNSVNGYFDELQSKVRGSSKEMDIFFKIQRENARKNVTEAFSADMAKAGKAIQPNLILGLGDVEPSMRQFKRMRSTLQTELVALKEVATPEEFAEFNKTFEMFTKKEYSEQIQGNIQSLTLMATNTLGIFEMIYDTQLSRMEERHEKQMTLLQEEHDMALALAGDNAIRRAIIEQDYVKKEKALRKEQEKEAEELQEKNKGVAKTQALINTFQAAIGAAADTKGNLALRLLAAGTMLTFGFAQVAQIEKQKFALGSRGTLRDGMGNSDVQLAYVSEGEYISDKKTVSALGGAEGFQQVVDRALAGYSNQGSITNVYIDRNYGSAEYARETYKTVKKADSSLWL